MKKCGLYQHEHVINTESLLEKSAELLVAVGGDLHKLIHSSNQLVKVSLVDTPLPGIVFKPGISNDQFDLHLALWLINNVICAYQQSDDRDQIVPREVSAVKPLFWRTSHFSASNPVQTLCGYIGRIKGSRNQAGDQINRIIVTIRGTLTLWDWLADAHYGQVEVMYNDEVLKIHDGFWKTYANLVDNHTLSLQDQMRAHLSQFLKEGMVNEVYITGHSLGAAVATLIAMDIAAYHPEVKSFTYTFGSPRVGNRAFALAVENLGLRKDKSFSFWRVANTEDLVPTMPMPVIGKDKFDHTRHFPMGTVGGVSFSINQGSIGHNHCCRTYAQGISRDKAIETD